MGSKDARRNEKSQVDIAPAFGNDQARPEPDTAQGRIYTVITLVAQAIASAVSLGLVNLAFFPLKSFGATPRAAAQAFQTKIGIL